MCRAKQPKDNGVTRIRVCIGKVECRHGSNNIVIQKILLNM